MTNGNGDKKSVSEMSHREELWDRIKGVLPVAAVGLILATIIVSDIALSATESRVVSGGPLEYVNPQLVLTPVVGPGGTLIVEGTKCNTSDLAVNIAGTAVFKQVDNGQTIVPYLSGGGRTLAADFCETIVWNHVIPDDLPPGVWVIDGIDTALTGDSGQMERWVTEAFEVLACLTPAPVQCETD